MAKNNSFFFRPLVLLTAQRLGTWLEGAGGDLVLQSPLCVCVGVFQELVAVLPPPQRAGGCERWGLHHSRGGRLRGLCIP